MANADSAEVRGHIAASNARHNHRLHSAGEKAQAPEGSAAEERTESAAFERREDAKK